MGNKLSVRKIISTANTEYVKWIGNERMILLVIVFIFLQNTVVNALLAHAKEMQSPLNILEPFIATINSPTMMLVIPFLFLALFADFPRMDGNTLFFLQRIGKLNWVLGQLLFAVYGMLSYLLFLFGISVVPVLKNGFLANGWSLVVTQYAKKYPDQAQSIACALLPENLYNQMSPYYACLSGTGLMMLYLLLIALVMLCFQTMQKKMLGLLTVSVLILLGIGTFLMDADVKWLFPAAHVTLKTHFTRYYAAVRMPVWASVLYMVIWIVVLIVLSMVCIKRMNYDSIQEMD